MPRTTVKVVARSNAGSYIGAKRDGDYCVFTLDGYSDELEIGDLASGDFDGDSSSATWAMNKTQGIEIYLYYESWGLTKLQAFELLAKLGSPTEIFT